MNIILSLIGVIIICFIKLFIDYHWIKELKKQTKKLQEKYDYIKNNN